MDRAAEERERIRRALIDLCYERSFAKLTLDQVLTRAEVDRQSFERHFADLGDCFFKVYEVELRRYQRESAEARQGLESWRRRVRATAYALYRFLADDKIRNFTAVDVRTAGEPVQLLIGQEIEVLFDLIDEGRQELEDPDSLTRATAESLGGGIFNQIYIGSGSSTVLPPAGDLIPPLMYSIVLPYLGAEAAQEELTIPPPPDLQGETREEVGHG